MSVLLPPYGSPLNIEYDDQQVPQAESSLMLDLASFLARLTPDDFNLQETLQYLNELQQRWGSDQLALHLNRCRIAFDDFEEDSQSLWLIAYLVASHYRRPDSSHHNTIITTMTDGEGGLRRSDLLPLLCALIDAGLDINASSETTSSALMIATQCNDLSLMSFLLERGANPNLFHQGLSPLHDAVTDNRLEAAELLLQHGTDVNLFSNEAGCPVPPLFFAVQWGRLEMMSLLAQYQARFDLCHPSMDTSLFHYAICKSMLEPSTILSVVRHMVELGAPLNAPDTLGYFPLHWAVYASREDLVCFLVEQGAALNQPSTNTHGDSEMHTAASRDAPNAISMVKLLMSMGSDFQYLNRAQQTPYDRARAYSECHPIAEYLKSCEVALLEKDIFEHITDAALPSKTRTSL